MKKIVTVKKQGSDLPIDLDISRIVAITNKRITEKSTDVDGNVISKIESYYIYFENAVWAVQADSYEDVHKAWTEYVQH
jgi:hypothetical protein